ncbi:MAG TPA: hypothetical protein DCL35_01425 [Candidatus Omnitrophica bacterium]|nr:hypothetical protein [Candidatus Omnitrophota bacterium]
MINKKRLIKLTQDVLRINSENPPGNEAAIAHFVAGYLKRIGLAPKIYSFSRDRDNVLAVLPARHACSRKSPRSILITPHLDTVPAGRGWRFDPFGGVLSGGKIYGRGASDCKGNLAVCLEVLSSLVEDGARLEDEVIFLATADEETGSAKGLIPFLEKRIIRPACALILDSDGFDIIAAQKGLIHFKVKVTGRRAHGAYPQRGINAIDRACRLIDILKKMKFIYKKHRFLKPPTINIGMIRGGDKVNIVADWCEFEVDLRFLPGMDGRKILLQIRRAFDSTGFAAKIDVNDIQQPYEIDVRHPVICALKAAAEGIAPRSEIKGSEGATVITFFKKMNIPAVATGYGARGTAHATDEYARISDLYRGARVLERFLKIFAGVHIESC